MASWQGQSSSLGAIALAAAAVAVCAVLLAGLFDRPSGAVASGPYKVVRNLEYGPGPERRLDLYVPVSRPAGPAPVVVFVHGGGWYQGDKALEMAHKADALTSAGYLVASVDYRLSPRPEDPGFLRPGRTRFPAHATDVARAIGWLDRSVAGYGGDPRRMALVGHSAGGQIVALLGARGGLLAAQGVRPSRIAGVVSLDAVGFDVGAEATPGTGSLGPLGHLMFWNAFGSPEEVGEGDAWRLASPLHHAGPADPPMLFVTQDRGTVPRRQQAEAMAVRLGQDPARAVVPVGLDHPGINLALGRPGDASGETESVLGFLRAVFSRERMPGVTLALSRGVRGAEPPGSRRVRFAFGSDRADARFACRMDRRRWRPCRSGASYRVGLGPHAFRVRATSPRLRPGPVARVAFVVVERRAGERRAIIRRAAGPGPRGT